MRKALVIGIDYYAAGGSLTGCVNDAHRVAAMLETHSDGSPNFDVMLVTASSERDQVPFRKLKDLIAALFKSEDDVALLYFAGHGHVGAIGGYICGSDSQRGDEGLALGDVMALAGQSKARNRLVILDSCYSGIAGADPLKPSSSEVTTGTTILTASRADEPAAEIGGGGVFTDLLLDALGGAAANLVGEITPGSVYAHIDQSLWSWAQRPVFKTNVSGFVSLRKVRPPIDVEIMRALPQLFPDHGFQLQLDPSFEPELPSEGALNPAADPENTKIFAQLQKLNRVGLLIPDTQPHMYHAAVNSDTVRLTALGEHYRQLALKKRSSVAEENAGLLERLAAIEHERWAHWQRFMHEQGRRQPDGSLVLPAELVIKWDRLIETPYSQLTEKERESDREQVRRYLPIVTAASNAKISKD